MAANEALNALSTTDASNTPSGGDTVGATVDDELRSNKANIARSARWEYTATVSVASTMPVTSLHKVIPVSGSAAGTTTITLPTVASAGDGFTLAFLKADGTNNVLIDGNGSEQIHGSTDPHTLSAQYTYATFTCNGTGWYVSEAPADGLRMDKGTAYYGLRMNSGATGFEWHPRPNIQIATLSATASHVFTPVYVDGMYRLNIRYTKSADCNINISTSDDAGVNYNGDSGDGTAIAWYEVYGGAFTSADTATQLGHSIDYGVPGGAGATESGEADVSITADHAGNFVWIRSHGTGHDTAGAFGKTYIDTKLTAHASGINRIRIKTTSGTISALLVLEELPLS